MPKTRNKSKSPVFVGFILSFLLHISLVIIILFWGFNTPASIKKPEFITGRIVTIDQNKRFTPKTRSRSVKRTDNKPVETKKTEKIDIKKTEEIKKAEKPKVKKTHKEKVVEPKPADKKVVDLSKKTEKIKAQQPKKEPVKQARVKPKPAINKSKELEKKKREILEKYKNERKRKDVLSQLEKESIPNRQVAKVDKGAYDITGPSSFDSAINSIISNQFVNAIRTEIASNWNIPPNIPTDGSLTTKVFFKINENGEIYDLRIEEPSGNSAFDEFCKRAVKKASPLDTPPPPEILKEAKTEGVEVSFTNSSS